MNFLDETNPRIFYNDLFKYVKSIGYKPYGQGVTTPDGRHPATYSVDRWAGTIVMFAFFKEGGGLHVSADGNSTHISYLNDEGSLHRDGGLPALIWHTIKGQSISTERAYYINGMPHRIGAPYKISVSSKEYGYKGYIVPDELISAFVACVTEDDLDLMETQLSFSVDPSERKRNISIGNIRRDLWLKKKGQIGERRA